MKTKKILFMSLILFFGLYWASAGNPKDKNEDLANIVIEKMNVDVVLNDSQKIALKKSFIQYVTKMEAAAVSKDSINTDIMRAEAYATYQSSIDSLLTPQQSVQLKKKINERASKK